MGCGGLLLLFGALPCFAVAPDLLITGEIGSAIFALIFAVALAIPAIFLIIQFAKKPKHKPVVIDEALERAVLGIVHQEKGRITATRLAMSTRLSLGQASDVLDQFERRNLAILTIGDGGSKIYEFPEFQTTLSAEDDFMQRLNSGVDSDARSVLHSQVEAQRFDQ